MKKNVLFIAKAAIIAALYAVLSCLLWQFSSMNIQVRVSEALVMLTAFTKAAVPGLTIGCFLANLLMGNLIDAVFGTLATMCGVACSRMLAKGLAKKGWNKAIPFLTPIPNILINAAVIPFVLVYGYGLTSFGNQTTLSAVLLLNAISVLIGEVISCYGIGLPLYFAVKKLHTVLFRD